jgi:hypothetical protein
MWLLEHRRSTSKEGRKVLLATVLACIGLAILPGYFSPSFCKEDPLFLIFWYTFLAIVGTLGLIYGIKNMVASSTFVCRLSRHALECDCPVSGCGETFAVAISEIRTVEKVTPLESDPPRWYIVAESGHRYWLTSNYGNPVERFVEAVKEINPFVTETAVQ